MSYLQPNVTLPPSIACSPSTFPTPTLPGASVVSISASLVQNYTASSPPFSNPNHGVVPPVTLDFCNVTITHTHPGVNDAVLTQIWLPTSTWNGRMQSIGGGGYIAGLFGYMFIAMDAAIAEGYAAVATNAGIYSADMNGGDAHTWAWHPNGTINIPMLENFVHLGLKDMTILGKEVVNSYYREAPKYSYFSGCSNGGRQGYAIAQRYPDAYDGIAACAPALYWDEWVENFWAQQLMNERRSYPRPCELDALSRAAIQACDKLDQVEDGILADPDACDFDPLSMVGKAVDCAETGGTVPISEIAAEIAKGFWTDERLAGVDFQAHSTGYDADLKYAAGTQCSSNGTCVGNLDPVTLNWVRVFVKKDLSWDPRNMTREEFEELRQQSVREYRDIIGISSYDLSPFRDAGGKMITYHGTSDPAVSYKNTRRFYDAVAEQDPSIHDYYRLFMAPGLGHSLFGKGAYPHTTFHALVDWVENGNAPDSLEATSTPDQNGVSFNRILCAYPSKAQYDGMGDTNKFSSYACVG